MTVVLVGLAEMADVTGQSHRTDRRLNHREKLLNEHTKQLADVELLTAHPAGPQRTLCEISDCLLMTMTSLGGLCLSLLVS